MKSAQTQPKSYAPRNQNTWQLLNARVVALATRLNKNLLDNSGRSNNCLIYAMAHSAGKIISDQEVDQIRAQLGQGVGSMLFADNNTVQDIAQALQLSGHIVIHNCYENIQGPITIPFRATAPNNEYHIVHRVNHYMALR